MQLHPFVGGHDVSASARLQETEINRDSTDAISTASITFFHTDTESVYGVARFGTAVLAFKPTEWQELQIKDQANVVQFGGFLTNITRESAPGGFTTFKSTAADYGILLDRILINSTWPAGWTDRNIILDAFAGQAEITVNPANIATIATDLGAFDAKDISLRELLERISELSGGEWRVDYSRGLHYYTAGTTAAPYAITDAGAGNHRMESLNRDSARLANRITVLGGFADGGELSSTASNLESQGRYGILSATIVDRQITDAATADLRARAEVAQRAFPIESGTFTTWTDGLDVGQTVSVLNHAYSLNGAYLIRAVRIKQFSKSTNGVDVAGALYCEYTVEFGQKQPDLITELRRTMQRAKQPTYEPVARPAEGTVGAANFASTIEPVRIVNSLPALPDAAYSDNAVVLLTTDRKLYRRSGITWTRSIAAADLTDQIQAGQLAADSVIAGTVAAGAIRAIDAVFEAAAIQRADLALAIIGDAQIDHATVNRIQIGTADITNLAVTNAKVNDLSASKLTAGTIDASVITVVNLNATNITTGAMSATRIGAGTISASVTLTSPTLVITSGSVTVNIDATNKILVTDTSFTRRAQIAGTQFRMESTVNGAFTQIVLGAFQNTDSGGSRCDLGVSSLLFNSVQVVGPRLPAVANPVGGVTIDSECRNQLIALLGRLRSGGHGLIES